LLPKAKQNYTFYLFVKLFTKYFCKLFLHGHKKAPPLGRAGWLGLDWWLKKLARVNVPGSGQKPDVIHAKAVFAPFKV
jgi:hypothetical protein